jgi:hypothetical protein
LKDNYIGKDIFNSNSYINKQLVNYNINKICTCSKTKCLKKYCECYSNNQYCLNCNCVDCHNKPNNSIINLNDEKVIVSCTCSKSNCNKKYCECYKLGEKCNVNCRCINCLNNEDNFKSKVLNPKKNLFCKYKMERISILIENKKIYIDIKQIYEESNISFHNSSFNKTSMVINNKKLLNKKRNKFLCLN